MAELMEYANKTYSNIIPKDEFEQLVHETFTTIADSLCRSLGPLGSSTTILDGMITEATKDGYSIMKHFVFHNRYRKMIYNLFLAPCTRMNNTVGDGTTTVIALTRELYDAYQREKKIIDQLTRLPRDFVRVWDATVAEISKRVKSLAEPLDPKDFDRIYQLAYVTSNGNAEISKAITNIYRKTSTPSIKRADSPTNESYVETIDGYGFPGHLIDPIWTQNEERRVTEKDIAVLVINYKIETELFKNVIIPINTVFRTKGKKLLVLAPFYDKVMCDTIVDSYLKYEVREHGSLNLILGQYESGKLHNHQLADLCMILRTKILTQDLMAVFEDNIAEKGIDALLLEMEENPESVCNRFIGYASSATMTCTSDMVFQSDGITEDPEYQKVLKAAEADLEEIRNSVSLERQAYASKIHDVNTRIQELRMQSFVYYIGANSMLQKQITSDAVDDVIKCLRSSMRMGIVPGCQLTIARICREMEEEDVQIPHAEYTEEIALRDKILQLIYQSIVAVYMRVLNGPNMNGFIRLATDIPFPTKEEELSEYTNKVRDKATDLINKSIQNGEVFDLETREYNPKIITSAETDIMALRSASDLVKILISGNQCLVCDAATDDDEAENRTVYV